jgi:hypothetical protein
LAFLVSAGVIFLRNQISKNKSYRTIHKARSGKINLAKLGEQLIYQVGISFKIDSSILNDLTENAAQMKQIEATGTRVIDVQSLSENELLLITEIFFEDQLMVTLGTTANLKKVFSTTYFLRYFSEKYESALYSSLFENDDTKRIRKRFRLKLIEKFT